MSFLMDPNVAYVLLVTGLVLAVLALFSPGTGFLEITALAAIALAGYSILQLPVNFWALLILLLGVVPFILAVRRRSPLQWVYLLVGIAALVIGTVFAFRRENGTPAIDPILAVVMSVVAVAILWLIGRKGLEVISQTPSHNLDRLIGMSGEALTDIQRSGSVYLGGENWSARSKDPIPARSIVRVTGREGLVLLVEPENKP
jgi:membrane-bound ClpP family serine protease